MFELNLRYNFVTVAPTIIGTEYNGLRVVGTASIDDLDNSNDMATIHEQIRAAENILHEIPVEELNFVKFRNSDEQPIVLAQEWIVASSVEQTNELNLTYIVKNVGASDKVKISQVLKSIGYHNVEVLESYV
jgi:hypothetical protein